MQMLKSDRKLFTNKLARWIYNFPKTKIEKIISICMKFGNFLSFRA